MLLDYDGTLAPFRVQRDKAFPYPGVHEILSDILKAQHSRMVLISGRRTKDLIPLLGLEDLPEIWGSHGMERLKTDGSHEIAELDKLTLQTLIEAQKWLKEVGLMDHCEQKPGSLALHWRGLADGQAKGIREMVITTWSDRAHESGLSLKEFDGGIELRASGRNKGVAVETILSEMSKNTVVAYLGDDLTDEDAFKAVKNKGVGVLVRKEFRPTAADFWLIPPKELLEFLLNWHKTCGGLE